MVLRMSIDTEPESGTWTNGTKGCVAVGSSSPGGKVFDPAGRTVIETVTPWTP